MIDEERYTFLVICTALETDQNFFSYLINQEAATANIDRINLITKLRLELIQKNEFLSEDVTEFVYNNLEMLRNSLETYRREYAELFVDEEEINYEETKEATELDADEELGIQGEEPIFADLSQASNEILSDKPNIVIPDALKQAIANSEPVTNDIEVNEPEPVSEPVQMQASEEPVQQQASLSITLALDNLTKELEATKREIEFLENLCYNSDTPAKKKHFEDLAKYEVYYKQVEELIEKTKQCQTFSDDTIKNDKRYQDLITKILEVAGSLNEKQSKIVAALKANRIKRLQEKQGKVITKQRKIVDGNILELNKKQMRLAAKESRVEGLNRYYDDQIARITEEKNAIIDEMEFGNNALINDLKEKYYRLKVRPYNKKIEKLKKLKEKSGKLRGFRKIKANLKSAKQELIDQLKDFKNSLIKSAEEEFEPLTMDEEMESGKIL